MNNKRAKRLLAMLLSLVMLLGLVPTAFAAETKSGGVTWEQVDGSASPNRFKQEAVTEPEETPLYAANEMVRVSIVLEAEPTIAVYSAESDISENAAAMSYRQQLLQKQESMAGTIARQALGGKKLDVVYNLTLASNIISANVPYGEIDRIKDVKGVEDVVLETRYTPDVVEIGKANPQMEVSSGMTGSSKAWSNGYTGAGMRIAIIDTGLDITHQSFDSEAFDYAIAEDEWKDRVNVAEYDLLDTTEIAEKLPYLNASKRMSGVTAGDLYVSSKIPFGFNYVDSDLNVQHTLDEEGEHGSHVAGIAAANRYLRKADGSFESALASVHMVGNAPDAQVLVMKVFGQGGGAYTSDYIAAIEDAIILGCDTVNLSLGSGTAGMAYNEAFSKMLESLSSSGTVLTISAGNNGAWAENTTATELYSNDVNFQTGGSPGSYTNSLGVASVDNDGIISPYFTVDGKIYFSTDAVKGSNKPFATLDTGDGTTYDYIFIDGLGTEEDFEKLGKDVVSGKIVFCQRGSINFTAKAENAVNAGAVATLVYNNTSGMINMEFSGYTKEAPAAFVSQADAAEIKAASTEAATEGGYTYYTGKLTVVGKASVIKYDSPYQTMSSFSSWGVPGDLSIKPEITAPGGNIYSLNGTHKTETGAIEGGSAAYELMSGTSMAAPQMAGIGALVKQAIEKRGLSQAGLSDRALAQSLLMSTATPLTDADGYYYSVMQQGAGLANADAATMADSYVLVNGQPDGKVKVELGDDPAKTGTYSFTFSLHNLDGKAHAYNLNADVFTQAHAADEDGTLYMMGDTDSLDFSDVSWTVNGVSAAPAVNLSGYDFDGDGDTDIDDAQALLDYVNKVRASISDAANADVDDDGDVDTHDVHAFLAKFTTGQVNVPANGSATIACTIKLNAGEAAELLKIYPNGFYVEAYAKVTAVSDAEGVVGTSHSIPVLGFCGNWTDASMFDKGGYVEYSCGLADQLPYLYSGETYNMGTNVLLIQYAGDPSSYYFGTNPYADGAEYDVDRVSLNNERGDVLSAWRYSPIRNAAAGRITVTDEEGTKTLASLGSVTAAYWSASQSAWQSMNQQARLGWRGAGLSEGDTVELALTLAPELYMNYADGSVDWDALGKGASRTVKVTIDNTAPAVNSILYNETDGTLTVTATDNRYVAAAFLFSQDGKVLDSTGSIKNIDPNAAGEYKLSLAKAEEGAKNFMVQVYDYADNVTTVKLTLGEGPSPATAINVSPAEVTILVGGTASLKLDVEPWNAADTFAWSSSAPEIATVKDGVITGVKEGSATITVTSTTNAALTADCKVTVKTVDIDLNAIVWGVDAKAAWATFNPKTLPDYKVQKDCLNFTAATKTKDGKIYAAIMNDDADDAAIYLLDDKLEATEIGNVNAGVGVTDLADAPNLGNYLIGTYGPYTLLLDKETGEYAGHFTWSTTLVGITYAFTIDASPVEADMVADVYYLVDSTGDIYTAAYGVRPSDGALLRLIGPTSTLNSAANRIRTGYTAHDFYSSLTYATAADNNDYLFWSRFDGETESQDLIVIDDNSGAYARLGGFDSEIWPVVGLMTDVPALASGESTDAIAAALTSAEATPVEVVTNLKPLGKTPASRTASAGSLNSVAVGGASGSGYQVKVDTVNHTVTVPVLAGDSTNGQYTVKYDPNVMTLQSAAYGSVLHSTADGVRGEVTVAYASAEAYNGLVSNLVFSYRPSNGNRVTDVVLIVKEDGTEKNTANVITAVTLPAEPAPDPDPVIPVTPVKPSRPSKPATPAGKSFDDVKPGDWFYDEVLDMAKGGYINGVSDRLFAPYEPLSRAMLVTILYRMDGEQAVSGSSTFTDVVKGSWYDKAVAWASANGIVTGYDANRFGPNDSVTRQQMASILWRYAKYKSLDVASNGAVMPDFPDRGQIASWAGEAVSWAYSRGVMGGRSDGRLDPNGKATRAEAAVMLYRFLKLTPTAEKQ